MCRTAQGQRGSVSRERQIGTHARRGMGSSRRGWLSQPPRGRQSHAARCFESVGEFSLLLDLTAVSMRQQSVEAGLLRELARVMVVQLGQLRAVYGRDSWLWNGLTASSLEL
jgi:hypothetical protein